MCIRSVQYKITRSLHHGSGRLVLSGVREIPGTAVHLEPTRSFFQLYFNLSSSHHPLHSHPSIPFPSSKTKWPKLGLARLLRNSPVRYILRFTLTATYIASQQLTSLWEVSLRYAPSSIDGNSTVLNSCRRRLLPKHLLHP
jgi:hypothetical protein